MTLRRTATKRAKDVGDTARDVGGVVGAKARELGGTMGVRAKELGGTMGVRAKELGGTIGSAAKTARGARTQKGRELRKAVGERTRRARRKVGYAIAGEEPPKRRAGLALAAAGAGAAAAFFLDPRNGKRRRKVAVDWLGARIRGAGQRTARVGRGIGARAYGAQQRVIHLGEGDGAPPNDPTLEQKVQSELFQGLNLPSKEISIMVSDGVVSLRGAVPRPELIKEIEARVRRIGGVRDVDNLLHLVNTPSPTTP